MDPYNFQVSEDIINNEDELKKLETELAPSSADYYGVLNISRKVS